MCQRKLLLLAVILLLTSCTPKFVPVHNPRTLDRYLDKITQASKRITQIKASVDIRGTGLFGQLFHERADIIAAEPHFLLWSLRSFFEAPAHMMASNGEVISIYDFSGNSESSYEQIFIDKNSVVDLFDFPFHPQSLINFFLNKVDLSSAKNLQIAVLENIWQIDADLPFGWQMKALFDEPSSSFKEIILIHSVRGLKYQVNYSELSLIDGNLFPKSLVVAATKNKRTLKIALTFEQLEINGPRVLPDTFFLKPH